MGTASAFFTFMSQKSRGKKFVASYVAWQFLQFSISLIFIGLIFPNAWINILWLGQQKELVLLAFAAVFMQQQAWQTVIQIGESMRLTYRVQIMNLCLAAAHIILITAMWQLGLMSPKFIFGLITTEYIIAILIACKVIPLGQLPDDPLNGKALFKEYRTYCTPLFFYSLIGLVYEFADRWLLQNFGGSEEQGFYSIGYHFSVISLLLTGSMFNIFWKEISEAYENKNNERIIHLYQKACCLLYFFAVVISALLIPWSEEITRIALGPAFVQGHLVVSVMFLFSAHRTLGMINGAMLLATGKTRVHLISGGIFMGISIPVSYFIQAPTTVALPGLGLGAMGMAVKVIVFNIFMVNTVTWWIGKEFDKKFDWIYQVAGMGGTLFLGWLSYTLAEQLAAGLSLGTYAHASIGCLLYFPMVGVMLWKAPWIAGTSQNEILVTLNQVLKVLGLSKK